MASPAQIKRATAMARPRGFERVQLDDPRLQRLQDNVAQAVEGLDRHPMLKGQFLEDVVLSADADGDVVTHGLGEKPRGWEIISINADARVWETSRDARQIVLRASAPCTVSLRVF